MEMLEHLEVPVAVAMDKTEVKTDQQVLLIEVVVVVAVAILLLKVPPPQDM
jgi:hypothetical protein